MKEKIISFRNYLIELLSSNWWVILIIIGIGYFFTDILIFRYIIYIIAIPFALLLFSPFIFQLFLPAFVLASSLTEHFRESKNMPFGKKYIFIPMAIISSVSFLIAQLILSIWVFIMTFFIWVSTIGFFFTFLLVFLFGLAPIAILIAPFLVWYNIGFAEFISVAMFFLLALFWFGFSKLALSEDFYSSTPEDFLGYSPQTFLIGAFSSQIIALPFYEFGFFMIGDIISDLGGTIFLLLALVSAFKWRAIKKKLTDIEKENLYKSSIWVYIFGLFFTNILYYGFQVSYNAPTAVLYWLNAFFFIAIIARLISSIKSFFVRRKPSFTETEIKK